MPKRQSKNKAPQINQTITQSVSIGKTWDTAAFSKLLEEQAKSNETAIKQLESSMSAAGANQQQLAEQIAQSGMMKDIRNVLLQELQDRKIHEETEKLQKIQERKAQQLQNHLKREIELKQKAVIEADRLNKIRAEEAKAIANIAKNMQTFKTMGDRLSETSKRLKDNFGSMSALKTTALKAFNIGGIFNKSIAKEKFIKQQRELGSTDDRKTLASKFEGANKAAKEIKKNEEEMSKFKKETGLSESDLAKTKKGKELIAKREQLSNEYAKNDLKAGLARQEPFTATATPTQKHADAGQTEEMEIEKVKQIEVQSDLLQKIADNTAGEGKEQKQKAASGGAGGGGIMAGIGAGLKALGGGLAGLGKGVGAGIQGLLTGIAKGVGAFGNVRVLKGAAAMAVLGGAVWVMGKALKEFEGLEWDTIIKGFTAIAGLGALGVILGNFVGPAVKGGIALAAIGAGMWVLGKGMQEMGDAFNLFIEGVEKLSNIGFEGLAGVAGGMVLVGGALAAFAAGQVAAGLGTLISNLLTIGQDSPIEQLQKLAAIGGDLNNAADGIGRVGDSMKKFAGIDKKSMEAINDFPWVRATAFVAAGGRMSANGATVENASKSNADAEASRSGVGGGNTTVVNAPVNNVTKNNMRLPSPIRNQESSHQRYLDRRYA
jgi:hypothetical protein